MTQNGNVRITPLPAHLRNNEVAKNFYQSLLDGRRRFGQPGAFMSHQSFDPEYTNQEGANPNAAKEMLEGERDTFKVLKDWLKDKPSAVLVSSVQAVGPEIPDLNPETGLIQGYDLDFVVLFGNDIIIVDAYRWPKNKKYTVADDRKSILMTKRPFPGNRVLTGDYIERIQRGEGGLTNVDDALVFTGLVLVNNEKVEAIWDKNWYESKRFRLVEIDRFTQLLDKKYAMTDPEDIGVINTDLAYSIVSKCVAPYNPFLRVIREKHLREFM